MDYVTTATTVASSSGGTGHTILTVIFLLIIGLAFPVAKRWANTRGGIMSLQQQWVLRQGKKVVASFDDEAEAAREFTRRITSKVPPA